MSFRPTPPRQPVIRRIPRDSDWSFLTNPEDRIQPVLPSKKESHGQKPENELPKNQESR